MQRAIYFLLMMGLLAGGAGAEEPLVYRGQTAEHWLQQLSHPSASARAAAAQALVSIGEGREDAVEPLIGLLSDRDARVRFYAAYALGRLELRPERCIAALIEALPDDDEHVRYTTQWSLARIATQINKSADGNTSVDKSIPTLLNEAETQLLVTGALPGHVKQVRAAIARFQATGSEGIAVMPPANATNDGAGEIDDLLNALASDDLHKQIKAIQTVPSLGPGAVRRLLESPDVVAHLGPVGWHLSRAIAAIGEPAVPVLTQALANPNEEIGQLASTALMDLGPAARLALPDLIKLLEDGDTPEPVKQRAIQVMIEMGPAAGDATDVLLHIFNDVDGEEWTQQSAAEALGAIGPGAKRAVPPLIDRLNNDDALGYIRPEIASALSRIDPKSDEVTEALVAAFYKSENIYDAISIAERLRECGPGAQAIVPRLIEAIDETSFEERAAVLRLLGELGISTVDEVSPMLFERLMDPTEELMVRVAAAKGLGKLGPASVQLIVNELQDGDEANQLIAARALVEIGAAASPAKDLLHESLQEYRADNELRSLAAVALGQLGSEASVASPALAELLRDTDSDSYLRAMCAVAIGQIDRTAIPILEATLDDPEPEVQIASAYALCKIDPRHARSLAVLARWLTSDEYRGSAVNAMIDIGDATFECVVETLNDQSQNRDTRVACLEVMSTYDERAIAPLLDALNDTVIAEDVGWTLRDRGNELIPTLVAGIEDETKFTPQARTIMSSVVEDMFSGMGGGGDGTTWEGGHALVRRPDPYSEEMSGEGNGMAAARAPSAYGSAVIEEMAMAPEPFENLEPVSEAEPVDTSEDFAESPPVAKGYKTVDVFYGTNRKPIAETAAASGGQARRWFWVSIISLFAVIVILVVMFRRGARWQATAGLAGTILIVLLGLLLFAPSLMRKPINKTGPRYGGEINSRVETGVCQVTIPDTHREGELEGAPKFYIIPVAEDLQKHIVLRSVQRMESDAFFAGLQKNMQRKGKHILVFIHGYNVSFEDAARRTAQMAADLKFAGTPVFYSWPSQANLLKYRMDEKNVELSVDPLKSFLLALAKRSNADSINLVAHSMGNRALTDALKEMDVATAEQQQLFNQVILAAPDIDADIFKHRIAPAIVSKAKHITLYASSKDLALVASRRFNSGDPRAGDAGENLVVIPGIETIDVSSGDSSLLGHSYYGDNISVLRDIEFVLQDRPANSRKFLEPVVVQDDLTYWMFQPHQVSRRNDPNYESR